MMTSFRVKAGISRARLSKVDFPSLMFILEAFFGGFYIAITRGITPIFLVTIGYGIKDLMLLNGLGSLFALLLVIMIYNLGSISVTKSKLIMALLIERIIWFIIPFTSFDRRLVLLAYGLALASTLPSSIFMNIAILSLFLGDKYRRVVSLRGALGGIASILGQLTVVLVLVAMNTIQKYYILYIIAFMTSLFSCILLSIVPNIPKIPKTIVKAEEEVEIKASTIFLMITSFMVSTTLLSIAWTPYIMRDLGAPDYIAASIGFIQAISAVVSNVFWIRRKPKTYRIAILLLSATPFLIYVTKNPLLHLGYAAIYGFTLVATNLYASLAYASLFKKLGAFKAGVMLSSTYFLALFLSGFMGYFLSYNIILVFIVSSIFAIVGLSIGLVAIPELAVVKPIYTRLYSRILYNISLTGYTTVVYGLTGTAKVVIKTTGLILALLILYIIYRMLYYIVLLSGGLP